MRFSSKIKKNTYRILVIAIIGILAIFFLNVYQKDVRNFVYRISEPIQRFFWRIGERTSLFFETVSEINILKNKNEELKLKNRELLAEVILLKGLKKENEILREALNIDLAKEFKLTLAEVQGKDISQDFVLINKGSESGLLKGLSVITQQKILVGRISEAYKDYSKVRLISNKDSSFEGEIAEKEILGQVKGKGNFELLFDLVPREQEIAEGDLVATTALGGIFPKGILVAEIKEVKKSDIQPFSQAELSPLFNLGELEIVFIILEF